MKPAQELLDQLNADRPPVDVASIASALGLHVKLVHNAQWDCALDVASSTIFVQNGTLTRVRFAIAHELAHWQLHRSSRSAFRCNFYYEGRLDAHEVQANGFAVDLLLPSHQVAAYSLYERPEQIAERFQVTVALVEHQLRHG